MMREMMIRDVSQRGFCRYYAPACYSRCCRPDDASAPLGHRLQKRAADADADYLFGDFADNELDARRLMARVVQLVSLYYAERASMRFDAGLAFNYPAAAPSLVMTGDV